MKMLMKQALLKPIVSFLSGARLVDLELHSFGRGFLVK
jgi:hypothetical protein